MSTRLPLHLLHMLGASALPVCVTGLANLENVATLQTAGLVTATLPKWRDGCQSVWATVHSVTARGRRALLEPAEARDPSPL